jgi:hypothetical protein
MEDNQNGKQIHYGLIEKERERYSIQERNKKRSPGITEAGQSNECPPSLGHHETDEP